MLRERVELTIDDDEFDWLPTNDSVIRRSIDDFLVD
jgi:hypothetical protein